jgi:hypothetical protein
MRFSVKGTSFGIFSAQIWRNLAALRLPWALHSALGRALRKTAH